MTTQEKALKKHDYEIMFKDSPEYFVVKNAKMLQEEQLVRFVCFDESDEYLEDHWYPIVHVYRIKRMR